ncbi:hypothetical protein QNM99_20895 [Pseudomonas sp. PCH446]
MLQLFDRSVIASAEIAMVSLECTDIRGDGKRISMRERISRLVQNLKAAQVRTPSTSVTPWPTSSSMACRRPNPSSWKPFTNPVASLACSLAARRAQGRLQENPDP